jgi:hypothetical protein
LAAGMRCDECTQPGSACPGGTFCCANGTCPPAGFVCAGPTFCPTATPLWCSDGVCAPNGAQCCGQGSLGGSCCGHGVYCPNGLACADCGGGVIDCGTCRQGTTGGITTAQKGMPSGVTPGAQASTIPSRGHSASQSTTATKSAPRLSSPHYASRDCLFSITGGAGSSGANATTLVVAAACFASVLRRVRRRP